jgi:hypothetical protein
MLLRGSSDLEMVDMPEIQQYVPPIHHWPLIAAIEPAVGTVEMSAGY